MALPLQPADTRELVRRAAWIILAAVVLCAVAIELDALAVVLILRTVH